MVSLVGSGFYMCVFQRSTKIFVYRYGVSPPPSTLFNNKVRALSICRLRRTFTPYWRATRGKAGGGAHRSAACSYSRSHGQPQQKQRRRRRLTSRPRCCRHRLLLLLLLPPLQLPALPRSSLLPSARFRRRSAPLPPRRSIRRCSVRCGRRRASPGLGWTGRASSPSSTHWMHCW